METLEYSKFYEAMDLLVEAKKEFICTVGKDLKHNFSPIQFALELQTIKVNPGRRVGKTSYINKRADLSSLVITYPQFTNLYTVPNVVNITDIREGKHLDNLYNRVYIDEPHYILYDMKITTLYEHLLPVCTTDTIFVLLGKSETK